MNVDALLKQLHAAKKDAAPHEAKHLHGNLVTLLTRGRSNKMSPVVKAVFKKKPARLLDIGCGYGAVAIFFALNGIETAGIDLGAREIEAAKKLAETLGIRNASFTQMDACEISLSGFDAALSTDFFEHLPHSEQPRHLRSVHQALKHGGAYLIRAPHRDNIRQHMTNHIGLPSYATLHRQAADAGFSVKFGIAHTSVFSPLNYHALLERWVERQNWKPEHTYKMLQKCGLANVVAALTKTA